jgi:hypothetical protein
VTCPSFLHLQVESVMNDFVRLGEESSYLESGMLVEGGGAGGVGDLLGSDDEHYLPDVAAVAGECNSWSGSATAALLQQHCMTGSSA